MQFIEHWSAIARQWERHIQLTRQASVLYSVYMDQNLVITVPADVLAPNSASPLPGTVMNDDLYQFISKFLWLWVIPYHPT